MISKAELRYIRISPRKFRLIVPLVKGKSADQAIGVLMSVKKKASDIAIQLIKSACANAKNVNKEITPSDLCIAKLIANGGPQLKRYRAGSMGRAGMIRKRTSHILIELDEIKKKKEAAKTSAKEEHKAKPKTVRKTKTVKEAKQAA